MPVDEPDPSFDELVDLLRVRLHDADAIKHSDPVTDSGGTGFLSLQELAPSLIDGVPSSPPTGAHPS